MKYTVSSVFYIKKRVFFTPVFVELVGGLEPPTC